MVLLRKARSGPELKYFDTPFSSRTDEGTLDPVIVRERTFTTSEGKRYVSTGAGEPEKVGRAICLNLIRQGNENNTRDGRICTLKSVSVQGFVGIFPSNDKAHDCVLRMMLVYDNAHNAEPSTPDLSTMLQSLPDSDPALTALYCFPRVDNQNRFTILWDKNIHLGTNYTTLGPAPARAVDDCGSTFRVSKKLNVAVQYGNVDEADQAGPLQLKALQNGALYLVMYVGGSVDDGAPALGSRVSIDGTARVRFVG